MQDVVKTKERILNIIRERGPSIPVQIARIINVSPLFTSVFLSELYEESKLRMSNMKIGSSSLYIIAGQEAQLENFIEHLNPREKEAFFLLKKEQVLEDEKLTPVSRVALRAIKDFAIPFKLTINNSERIFWKYFLSTEQEVNQKLRRISDPLAPLPPIESKITPQKITADKENGAVEPPKKEVDDNSGSEQEQAKQKPKKKPSSSFAFPDKLKDYLASKEIEILESILEKKNEFAAKIRADTLFGKQEYYLIAKDKKKINETDLALALQKAQNEKMPSLIISPGEVDKKALQYLKDWRNLLKFEKVKF